MNEGIYGHGQLPGGGHPQNTQGDVNRSEQQAAQKNTQDRARATEDVCPANHHRGYDRKFKTDPCFTRVDKAKSGGIKNAGQSGRGPSNRIDQKDCALDGNAPQPGGVRISANSVDIPAPLCVSQEEGGKLEAS